MENSVKTSTGGLKKLVAASHPMMIISLVPTKGKLAQELIDEQKLSVSIDRVALKVPSILVIPKPNCPLLSWLHGAVI